MSVMTACQVTYDDPIIPENSFVLTGGVYNVLINVQIWAWSRNINHMQKQNLKQSFSSFSLLWIVQMITIDPLSERMK